MIPQRHDLVWCAADAVPPGPDAPILRAWFADNRPAVIRRRYLCDPAGDLPVALTLPNARGRRRLAFTMPRGALRRSAPPPHLTAALRSAPPAWRDGWPPDLLGLARVHGGLMWQHLTGETYPRPNSDIDLVPRLDTLDGLDRLVRSLLAIADRVAPRIDGEIVFPNQNAVAWREWLADTPLVMVKQSDRVELVARRALLGPSPTGLIDAATYL